QNDHSYEQSLGAEVAVDKIGGKCRADSRLACVPAPAPHRAIQIGAKIAQAACLPPRAHWRRKWIVGFRRFAHTYHRMQSTDDGVLLRQYADNHSEEAFTTLVSRYLHLVYSVSFRH